MKASWFSLAALLVATVSAQAQTTGAPPDGYLRVFQVDDFYAFSLNRTAVMPEDTKWCPSGVVRVSAARPDFQLLISGPDGNTPSETAAQIVKGWTDNARGCPSPAVVQFLDVIEDETGAVWRYENATKKGTLVSRGEPVADLWASLGPALQNALRTAPPVRQPIIGDNLAALSQAEEARIETRCAMPDMANATPEQLYSASLNRSRCFAGALIVLKAALLLPGGAVVAPLNDNLAMANRAEQATRSALGSAMHEAIRTAIENAPTPQARADAAVRRLSLAAQLRSDGSDFRLPPIDPAAQIAIESFLLEKFAAATSFADYRATAKVTDTLWAAGAVDERRLVASAAPNTARFATDVEAIIPKGRGVRAIYAGLAAARMSARDLRTIVRYLPDAVRPRLAQMLEQATRQVAMQDENGPAAPRAPNPM